MSDLFTKEQLQKMDQETLISLLLSMQSRITELSDSVNRLTEQIVAANNYRFGRHTEKYIIPDGQMSVFDFFNEAEAVAQEFPAKPEEELTEEITYKRRKTKGKREADLEGLPVDIIDHEIKEEQLREIFGDKWKTLPDEVYKRLIVIPAEYRVEEHHVKVYASKDPTSEAPIVKAPHPAWLIRNSIASPSLVSHICSEKFVKSNPYNRQEQDLKRNGINIPRANMANWVIICSEQYLSLMYDWLHEQIYKYHVLQADETPVLVTKDGRTAGSKSYMWVYRTGKMYKERQIILYEYQKERKADHPREFLKGFSGVLVTDGYQVYHLLADEREDLDIAGCWSHARRRFSEAVKAVDKEAAKNTVADEALRRIGAMFSIEKTLADLTPDERKEQRQKRIKPLVEAYFAWIKEIQIKVPANSKTGKGITYSLNQEKYLRYFLEDGEVPMDNNSAEITIRSFVIGKKNWVMIDTIAGAKASAIVYSLVETAKANGLNPEKYLDHLLTEIPQHMDDTNRSFLEDLAPWSDKLPESVKAKITT